MSTLMIREVTPSDAQALQELYLHHLTQTPQPAPKLSDWEEKIARFVADENYCILVGTAEGQVVSSVTLIVVENLTHGMRPYALIENVVTHAAHRKKGYAGALMEAACTMARNRSCYKVMLLTGSKQEGTLSFYRKCGFNSQDKTGFVRWFG